MTAASALSTRSVAAMPAVFVLIWSTGFVVARYAMPHAPPFTFLCLRYALSVAAFLVWIGISRPAWPTTPRAWWHLGVTGLLIHAGYLGGVWAAVKAGIPAGTVAIIVGLQPVLTAVWLSRFDRHASLSLVQWAGVLLGFLGLVLVVWRKFGAGEVSTLNLSLSLLALASITAGTLYQKRFVAPQDVRTANTIQLAAALLVSLPLAWMETEPLRWHPELVGALAWSVLGLSLGGSSLLYLLIQKGAAVQVSSLMYLVPPCTALLAAALFGETLTPWMILGMLITAAGVALVQRVPRSRPARP